MPIRLVTSPEIIPLINISFIKLIIPLPIHNTSLKHFKESMHFFVTLNFLTKALKNDRGRV